MKLPNTIFRPEVKFFVFENFGNVEKFKGTLKYNQ